MSGSSSHSSPGVEDGIRYMCAGSAPFEVVALDAAGGRVLATDRKGQAYLFDAHSGEYTKPFHMQTPAALASLSSSADARAVVALSDTIARAYDLGSGNMIEALSFHRQPIHTLIEDASGSVLLTASSDAAALWSTQDWKKLRALGPTPTSGPITHATFLRQAGHLAVAFADDTVMVWNVANFGRVAKLVLTPEEVGARITAISGSPDGTLVVAGAANGCLYLWDVPTQTVIRIVDMPAPSEGVRQVAVIHPAVAETIRLATGADTGNGSEGAVVPLHMQAPQLVALDNSGKLILIDLKPAQPSALWELESVSGATVTSFSLSDDAQTLAAVLSDGRLVVFDLPTAVVHHLAANRSASASVVTGSGGETASESRSGYRPEGVSQDSRRGVMGPPPPPSSHPGSSTLGVSQPGSEYEGDSLVVKPLEAEDAHALERGTYEARSLRGSVIEGGEEEEGEGRGEYPVRHGQQQQQQQDGGGDLEVEQRGGEDDSEAFAGGGEVEDDNESVDAPHSSVSEQGLGLGAESGRRRVHGKEGVVPGTIDVEQTARTGGVSVANSAARGGSNSRQGSGGGQRSTAAFAATTGQAETRARLIRQTAPTPARSRKLQHTKSRPTAAATSQVGGASPAPLHDLLTRALTVPVFGSGAADEVRQAAADAATGTHAKLRTLMSQHGRFPEQYRPIAWRFLLRLPNNTGAFEALVARGAHPAWCDLARDYPVRDRRLLTRLAKVVNALAAWSPVFGELPFLPSIAFPFVKFFASDDLAAFETVMTVLTNWGRNFIETLPHPPVPLLARVHVLLSYWDTPLAAHLEACGVDASRYAWPLLRSAFSEVLTREEWEVLWDNLFVNAGDASLMVYAVVAYMRYIRASILDIKPTPPGPPSHPGAPHGSGRGGLSGPFRGGAVDATLPLLPTGQPGFSATQAAVGHVITPAVAEICALLRNQNAIHLPSVIKTMYDMRAKTPDWAQPLCDASGSSVQAASHIPAVAPGPLRHDGPTSSSAAGTWRPDQSAHATSSATGFPGQSQAARPHTSAPVAAADSRSGRGGSKQGAGRDGGNGGPTYPLPRGHYPPFLKYPRAVVDYAIAERERIAADEAALAKKKSIAALLARRTAELAVEEEAWRLERRLVEAGESQRVAEQEALTSLREREASLIEEEVRSQRLAAISGMQQASREALATQRARRAALSARNEAERVRLAKTRDTFLRNRVTEEALLSLELQAMQRVAALNEVRDEEEGEVTGAAVGEARVRAAGMADELLGEAWRVEDEERRVRRAVEVAAADKLSRTVSQQRQRASQDMVALIGKLERETAISAIERERRIRHATEDAAAETHGIAAAMLQAENDVVEEALWRAQAEVDRHAHVLQKDKDSGAAQQAALADQAHARSREKLEYVRRSLGSKMVEAVSQRVIGARQQEAASVGAERGALDRISRMYAANTDVPPATATGASTDRPSLASHSRSLSPTRYKQAASEGSGSRPNLPPVALAAERAVDMGAMLVQREVAILKAELDRVSQAQGRLTSQPHTSGASGERTSGGGGGGVAIRSSLPARPPSPPARPTPTRDSNRRNRQGRRDSLSGEVTGEDDMANLPLLGGQASSSGGAGHSLSTHGHPYESGGGGGSGAASGVSFGVVEGGRVVATPSIGSRQRTLAAATATGRDVVSGRYQSSDLSPARHGAVDAPSGRMHTRAGRLAAEASVIVSGVSVPPGNQGRGRRASRTDSRSRGSRNVSVGSASGGYTSGGSGSPLSQRPLDREY